LGDIIIEETNYKAFILAVANLFMLIAACAVTVYGFMVHKLRFWLPGILLAFIFFIGFLRGVALAAQEKRLLTITTDGIIDSSSRGGVGFIPFDVIKEFKIITLYNKQAIVIVPKNVDSFLSKLTMVKRKIVKRNIHLNLPPVAIYVDTAKDMEPEDILSLLMKRLSDYSRLYG
jgi:hypothetical protein